MRTARGSRRGPSSRSLSWSRKARRSSRGTRKRGSSWPRRCSPSRCSSTSRSTSRRGHGSRGSSCRKSRGGVRRRRGTAMAESPERPDDEAERSDELDEFRKEVEERYPEENGAAESDKDERAAEPDSNDLDELRDE